MGAFRIFTHALQPSVDTIWNVVVLVNMLQRGENSLQSGTYYRFNFQTGTYYSLPAVSCLVFLEIYQLCTLLHRSRLKLTENLILQDFFSLIYESTVCNFLVSDMGGGGQGKI